MRIMSVIMLAFSLSLSARTVSQTVTFKGENVPLTQLFEEVKKQTGFYVMYSNEQVANAKPVSIEAQQLPVNEFVSAILKNQPFQFSIEGNTVFIRTKVSVVDLSPRLNLEIPPLKGVIRDAEGNPVQGVNVVVKGTKKGVTTDAYGNFSIEAEANEVLVISSVGFSSKEVKVLNTDVPLLVALDKSVSQLDEVQYIAYGTNTQRYNIGNVSNVKAADIEKHPVNNPLQALQGRVPGLNIVQQSGLSGGSFKIQIRGQNSIQSGNEPLYIVDGVPIRPNVNGQDINAGLLGGNSLAGGPLGQSPSALAYMNIQDIESIDVLKDADATAIYGSRGANGVILITTKKGKTGPTKVLFNVQYGIGKVGNKIDLLGTPEYLEMRREAFLNDGLPLPTTVAYDNSDLLYWNESKNTNWQSVLIGGTAKFSDNQISIRGGNSSIQYNISGNYHKETTVFPGDFSDRKGGVHFSITGNSLNKKFRTSLTGGYYSSKNQLPSSDLTNFINIAPNAPDPFLPNGNLNWAPLPIEKLASWDNPMASLLKQFDLKVNNLMSSGKLSYTILPGLEVATNIGYNVLQSRSHSATPFAAMDPAQWPFTIRTAIFSSTNSQSWIAEPMMTYSLLALNGKINILAGGTIQNTNSLQEYFTVTGFTSDGSMNNLQAGSSIQPLYSTKEYKYRAVFGRINYNYLDKYILSINARRDGSSRFGPQRQYANFASIGGGWVFSEERFIKKKLRAIDYGKIRISYGTSGNDQINDYMFLESYAYNSVSYQGQRGLRARGIYDPYYSWETTKKLEAGLEVGLFKNSRVLTNVSYYRNRSFDQLLTLILPVIAGPGNVIANSPAVVQNSGWEFVLNAKIITNKSLTWSVTMHSSFNGNKLIESYQAVPSQEPSPNLNKSLGYSLFYRVLGVDREKGVYVFADNDGKPTIDPGQAYPQELFDLNFPRYFAGFNNTIQYKGLQLDLLFQLVKQQGRNYIQDYYIPGYFNFNQHRDVLNRWQKEGDISTVQKFGQGGNMDVFNSYELAKNQSEIGYTDASYIRLKNVALSYSFPHGIGLKRSVTGLRVYFQGQNLWTYTKYRGLDPESLSNLTLPPLRTLTFGIQLTL